MLAICTVVENKPQRSLSDIPLVHVGHVCVNCSQSVAHTTSGEPERLLQGGLEKLCDRLGMQYKQTNRFVRCQIAAIRQLLPSKAVLVPASLAVTLED